MPRRVAVLLAVVGLTALSAPVAAASASSRPASSVALLGSDNATFRVAKGVAGAKPVRRARLASHDNRAVATAISADGTSALACADSTSVYPVAGLRIRPRLGKPLNAARFSNEGGKGNVFFCDGVAQRRSFALVAGDSQGVAQLVRKHGSWKVDTRVHSPGVNESGHPHRPGWVRFRKAGTSRRYTVVSIAPRPLPGGGFLAVAVDREHGTVAVVRGAGTPNARNVAVLTSPRLVSPGAGFGTGGIAWQPSAGNRALITTGQGFAVLDLRHPAKPRLERLTRVGDGLSPGSLTVSSDGDHLAVAAGKRIYGYDRVRAAVAKGRKFRLQTSFRLSSRSKEAARDVAYTANDNLVVLHGDDTGGWFLTVVAKVTKGHHAVKGSMRTTRPVDSGSLSVWPAP